MFYSRVYHSIAILALLFFLLISPLKVLAHSADTSTYAIITIPEKAEELFNVSITIPAPLLMLVLDEKLDTQNPAEVKFQNYREDISNYISDNFRILSGGELCSVSENTIPEQDQNNVLFGTGLMVENKYKCEKDGEVVIENTMFVDRLHHTNSITIYKGSTENLLQASLLTKDVTSLQVGNAEVKEVKNDSQKADWISKLTSQIGEVSLFPLMGIVFLLGLLHTLEAGHSKTILGGMLVDRKVDIKQAMGYITIFTVTHIADIVLIGIIFLVANSFVDVYSQLPYLQIFSLYALMFISFYLLLKAVVELIKEGIHKYQHKHNHEHHHHHEHDHEHEHEHGHTHAEYDSNTSFGKQLLMGFVAGLAPCLFGWTIFMAVLSTRNIWALFPVIISFGLGIFLALTIFALIVLRLKKSVLKEGSIISHLSPILSSLILFIYSLTQIL
ncbi:MAG TPA: sulfite exporter TauE/SafE family protein [Candidatus Dojkabacteria bacterium]|nr:sulfite exporter TauE/SafE family protein [Candidatus Dojkabacteria bacterium]